MTYTRKIITVLCAAFTLLSATPTQAQTPAAPTAKVPKLTKMQEAFQGVQWATDNKPNLKARYYIYLLSASWCGPCQRLMPQIVEAYKTEMKEGKRVEIILTACEQRMEDVAAYVNKYGATFPAIHISHPDTKNFVGFNREYMRNGIPYVVICDNEGNVLARGNGGLFASWKDIIKKDKEAKNAAKK